MFEQQAVDEMHRLQAQMAALQRRYGSFCPEPLQTALQSAPYIVHRAGHSVSRVCALVLSVFCALWGTSTRWLRRPGRSVWVDGGGNTVSNGGPFHLVGDLAPCVESDAPQPGHRHISPVLLDNHCVEYTQIELFRTSHTTGTNEQNTPREDPPPGHIQSNTPSAMLELRTGRAEEPKKGERKMYKTYAYGHDFGNAEVCGVLLKGNTPLMKSIPTAFAQVNTNRFTNLGIETKDFLVIRFQDEVAEWGLGVVALSQSIDPWDGRGDLMRYANKHSLRAILAISASLIPDKEYGLHIATGLPAETYQKNPDLRKDIRAMIAGKPTKEGKPTKVEKPGTYIFTVDGGKTWRTCHLSYATTLMEGAGGLMAYTRKEDISPQGAGVIDIGGRTTDLYVAQGGTPVADLCVGKPLGVVTAAKRLQEGFEVTYKCPLSPLETRSILFAYANSENLKSKPYPELSAYGKKIPANDLDKLAREAVNATTSDIVSFVSSAWNVSDSSAAVAVRFDPVINIGGGTYYFYSALKERIPHLQRPEHPVFANALGYARAAAKVLEMQSKKEAEESAAQTDIRAS